MTVYEGMFLLDNDLVRAGWPKAKATVTGLLEKHGGKVLTSRRWDERRLAYRIKRRNRATFLLAHYELGSGSIPAFQRDLEINESVLRYMLLKVDEVPAEETELTKAEEASDFVVPEPPDDNFDEIAARRAEEERESATRTAEPEAKRGDAEAAEGSGAKDEPKAKEPAAAAATTEAVGTEAATTEAVGTEAAKTEAAKTEAAGTEAAKTEATQGTEETKES